MSGKKTCANERKGSKQRFVVTHKDFDRSAVLWTENVTGLTGPCKTGPGERIMTTLLFSRIFGDTTETFFAKKHTASYAVYSHEYYNRGTKPVIRRNKWVVCPGSPDDIARNKIPARIAKRPDTRLFVLSTEQEDTEVDDYME